MLRLAIGRALLWLIEPAQRKREFQLGDIMKDVPAAEGPLRPFLTDPDRPRYAAIDGE